MLHFLSTVVLGPILLAQGRTVRRQVTRLPEPPGARVGTQGQGPPLRVLVLGDSAAAGVGADAQATALLGRLIAPLSATWTVHYRLIARTGSTTASVLHHLGKQSQPEPFDVAVTSMGVNDVTAGRSLKAWEAQQRALVELLATRHGVRHLFVSGLPPVGSFPALPQPLRWYLGRRARQFDAVLQTLAEERGTHYVNLNFPAQVTEMAADGFHPGPAIYAAWGTEVARRIAEVIADAPPS